MSNPRKENFQTFPSGIPGQPPAYATPYAGQQYGQPQIGQPQVQSHHLPAAPVVVEQVSNTVPVTFGRTTIPTICPHCQNNVSYTTESNLKRPKKHVEDDFVM